MPWYKSYVTGILDCKAKNIELVQQKSVFNKLNQHMYLSVHSCWFVVDKYMLVNWKKSFWCAKVWKQQNQLTFWNKWMISLNGIYLSWNHVGSLCTSEPPTKIGPKPGFVTPVKNRGPRIVSFHCFQHWQANPFQKSRSAGSNPICKLDQIEYFQSSPFQTAVRWNGIRPHCSCIPQWIETAF